MKRAIDVARITVFPDVRPFSLDELLLFGVLAGNAAVLAGNTDTGEGQLLMSIGGSRSNEGLVMSRSMQVTGRHASGDVIVAGLSASCGRSGEHVLVLPCGVMGT